MFAGLADAAPADFAGRWQLDPEASTSLDPWSGLEMEITVGADGQVKSLYCYEHNQAELAMAAAAALIRWNYEPVKIGPDQVAVPVLLRQKMLFTVEE